jgi:hypothetical protein
LIRFHSSDAAPFSGFLVLKEHIANGASYWCQRSSFHSSKLSSAGQAAQKVPAAACHNGSKKLAACWSTSARPILSTYVFPARERYIQLPKMVSSISFRSTIQGCVVSYQIENCYPRCSPRQPHYCFKEPELVALCHYHEKESKPQTTTLSEICLVSHPSYWPESSGRLTRLDSAYIDVQPRGLMSRNSPISLGRTGPITLSFSVCPCHQNICWVLLLLLIGTRLSQDE